MNKETLVELVCSGRSCHDDFCPFCAGRSNCTANLKRTEATLREWAISSNYLLDDKLVKSLSSNGYTVDDFLNAIGLECVDFV